MSWAAVPQATTLKGISAEILHGVAMTSLHGVILQYSS